MYILLKFSLPGDWLSALVSLIGILLAFWYTNRNTNKQLKQSDEHVISNRIYHICAELNNINTCSAELLMLTSNFFNDCNNVLKDSHKTKSKKHEYIRSHLENYKKNFNDNMNHISLRLSTLRGYIHLIFKITNDRTNKENKIKNCYKSINNYHEELNSHILSLNVSLMIYELTHARAKIHGMIPKDEFLINQKLGFIQNQVNKIEKILFDKINK